MKDYRTVESQVINSDCLKALQVMPAESVHCIVTSPPYYGLRNYGVAGQIGLEESPEAYVQRLVTVFRECRRVLRKDGTLWLNLGDTFASAWACNRRSIIGSGSLEDGKRAARPNRLVDGLKEKDLIGIPWMVAFALRSDGWFLRQDIIWSKPNPMPESVKDRCTKSHEYLFMLSKSRRYHYDAAAIKNPPTAALVKQVEEGYAGSDSKDFASGGAQSGSGTKARIIQRLRDKIDKQWGHSRKHAGFNERWDRLSREEQMALGSNKRSVWTISPRPFKGAHFATFPPALVEPCIKAGCPAGGIVLDPFAGSGTTGEVALRLGRGCVLIELNPEYVKLIEQRIAVFKRITPPLFDLDALTTGKQEVAA